MHTDRTDSTTPDLTAVAALNGPLEQAGWTLDAVTEMSAGSVDYLYLHPSGRQVTAVTAPAGEPVELTLTGLTLDQAVGAVTGAGYAPAVEVEPTTAPTPDLLAAVRQVIDAERLEWGTGVDVDRVQGEAHAALVRAYEAATGGTTAPVGCVLCRTTQATAGECCSSHGKRLCRRCYRRTHWVEVCVAGCPDCAAEGLPVLLSEVAR